jgi:2',3'-cyclic-nucleotide 2'-phosphodiesterase (5'-nucleotidase family)
MGGLARRAALYDLVKKDRSNVLILDGGDLFGVRTEADRAQSDFLCEHTAKLGYKLFGLGEWDLNYGMNYLREKEKKYGFKFLCANLRSSADGPLLFPPYEVVQLGGIRVGVISVLDPELKIVTMSADADNYVMESPRDALQRELPELRKKADLIVLLAHITSRDTRQLLLDLGDDAGIDVCIEGHDARQYQRINKVGNTHLLAANNEGKYVGQLDMMVTPGGDIADATLTMHGLDDKSPQVDTMQKLVDDFAKANEVRANTNAPFAHPRDKGNKKERFLGAANCSQCHSDIYNTYLRTTHARAFDSLVTKGQADNTECIGSHVVGFEFENGYDRIPDPSIAGRETLKNVQCEACHGYGSGHDRSGKWLAEAKSSCIVCHDAQNSPGFDYDSYWAKIAH